MAAAHGVMQNEINLPRAPECQVTNFWSWPSWRWSATLPDLAVKGAHHVTAVSMRALTCAITPNHLGAVCL